VAQVGDRGLADVDGQRKPLLAASLAAHRDLAVVPVDVGEFDRGHLPGSQSQAVQHREDGEVTQPHHRVLAAAGEHRGYRLGTQRPRQGPPSPAGRGGHRRPHQLAIRVALHEQEPQQRPQPRDQHLGRRDTATATLANNEGGHVPSHQAPHVEPIRSFAVGQKQPGHARVAAHGARGQPPLAGQVVAVALHQHLHRRGGHRLRRGGHHAQATQVAQQRRHSSLGQLQGVAICTPGLEELLHPSRHQLTRCQPLAHQPAAHMRHQLQLACGARRGVALPDQLLTETVSVRYERTCHAQSTWISHDGLLPGSIPVQEASSTRSKLCGAPHPIQPRYQHKRPLTRPPHT
jgi:hypothetical protein